MAELELKIISIALEFTLKDASMIPLWTPVISSGFSETQWWVAVGRRNGIMSFLLWRSRPWLFLIPGTLQTSETCRFQPQNTSFSSLVTALFWFLTLKWLGYILVWFYVPHFFIIFSTATQVPTTQQHPGTFLIKILQWHCIFYTVLSILPSWYPKQSRIWAPLPSSEVPSMKLLPLTQAN